MHEPFFIVGFQRSGTTLLRLMLDNHPDIAIPLDTTGLWDRFERQVERYGDLATKENRERLVNEILQDERIRLWEAPISAPDILQRCSSNNFSGLIDAFYRSYAASRGKTIWGDKDPGNMTRIDQLNRWFPACQIIHIVRDGRDACLSHLGQSFGFDNILACASAWREEVQWVQRMGGILGPRYFELRYEDLVADPAHWLEKLCAFLGVPYDKIMLDYHSNVEKSVPDSKRHLWPLLNQAPRADNAGRWKAKMTAGQRICFEKRSGEVLKSLGYEVLPGKPSGAYFEELRNMAITGWRAFTNRLRSPRRPQP